MGGELYNCKDPAVWRSVFTLYSDVVEEKTTTSKGRKAGKLAALDKWYQEELPRAVSGRTEKYLTHAELVQLMEWKLTISETHIRNCAKAIEHVTIPGVCSLESILVLET
ncbi:hypothetical protein scyTo_0012852 [Scyliorhinus torazame]|uniref:Uncharacterized protein n=1 Tax=Scyliorhinus torazame TaxID=75743 RepID=A0A401NJM1_SCYTO|nr:hypothetical protein [Scyliorhinus torazame]